MGQACSQHCLQILKEVGELFSRSDEFYEWSQFSTYVQLIGYILVGSRLPATRVNPSANSVIKGCPGQLKIYIEAIGEKMNLFYICWTGLPGLETRWKKAMIFFWRSILFDPAYSNTNSYRMSSKDPSLLSLVKVSSIDFNFHWTSLAVFLSFSITLL